MYINIHTHKLNTEKNDIAILNVNASDIDNFEIKNHNLLSSGIHPWEIKNKKKQFNNLSVEKLFAIGEVGLDKSIDTPLSIQKEIFIKQIKIANKNNLPIIIHCVKAVQEIVNIKKEYSPNDTWIFHGFNKNIQIAEQLIKQNFMLSFGKDLFNGKYKNVIAEIPQNKIFLETDNSDYKISDIYNQAADIMNISINNLEEIILNNFNNLSTKQAEN